MGMYERIVNRSSFDTGRFICHLCQAPLGNLQTLRSHIKKTHLALKTERCRTCGEAFRWASQLERHKKREHGGTGQAAKARRSVGRTAAAAPE